MACGGHVAPNYWTCTCNSHGTNSSDKVYYSTPTVSKNWLIRASHFDAIEVDINAERARYQTSYNAKYNPDITLPAINIVTGIGNTVDATDFNTMAAALNELTLTAPSTAGVSIGTLITAAKVNELINNLKVSGATCVCNCNYCSCNCNYCTCNCNYSCTCNCNYSDENLKTNIEYL